MSGEYRVGSVIALDVHGEFSVTETERHPTSRALVASFLFTDLVGYSKGTAAEQYAAKATLSSVLRRNLATLLDVDYRIKDTGDGALIAFTSSPEHALYMALAIAEDFGQAAGAAGFPSNRLRTGLHLGSVKESTDLEARPNFVGDGINAAKRIMDFAEPGQITASRAFFEAVGSLDSAYAELFRHIGAPDDKHGRAHELYAVAPSAAVLQKLKLDLAPAADEPAQLAANIPTPPKAPKPPPNAARAIAADTSATPSRGGFGRKALFAVIAALAVGAVSLFVVNKLNAPSDSKSPEAAIAPPVSPPTPKQATAPPASDKTASESQAPTAIVPKPEPAPPVSAAGVAASAPAAPAPAPDSAQPAATPTAASAKATAKSKPKAEASSPAPVSASAPSERSSPRCSRIMEKATLGETLTPDEKKELASSCR
jgi:class 3 adenylate cyclase